MRVRTSKSKLGLRFYIIKTYYDTKGIERTITVEKLGSEQEIRKKTGRSRSYRWDYSLTAKAFQSRCALIPAIPIALPSMPGREIFAGKKSQKGLTGNCITHIIRLRKLYYSRSTVCDEVLQYLFM